ncbi:MAG: glycosyltransferase family 39 protein, partial [Anaerolineae bacterium]|nr:glycosyltransferase family 39 protein [Anaerolineae bacterium]
FWWDEMFTLRDTAFPFTFRYLVDLNPVSFILIHMVFNIFHVNEWNARVVPALIGIATIPFLYFPVRKIFGSATALVVSLSLAIAPWHIYWSQSARFYTALLLFYSLGMLYFYIGLEEDRLGYLLMSLVWFGLAVNERLTALLFVPVITAYIGLLVILPIEKPRGFNVRNLAVFIIPGAIGAVGLGWKFLINPYIWFKMFGWTNSNPIWIMGGVVFYVGVPVVCIALLAALYKISQKDRAGLYFLLGAVVPLIAVMMLSLIQYSANRYVFMTLTSWVILSSIAAIEVLKKTAKRDKLLSMAVLVVLIVVPMTENMLYYKYQNGNRDNWKQAFALVDKLSGEKDIIITSNALIADYYLEENTISLETLDLNTLYKYDERIWFVEDMNVEDKWPEAHEWFKNHAQLVENLDVHVRARNFKMRIYMYDQKYPSHMQVSD